MKNKTLHLTLLTVLIFTLALASCKKVSPVQTDLSSVHTANAVVKTGCLLVFKLDENTEYTPENIVDEKFRKNNLPVTITYRFTGHRYRSAVCDYATLDDSQLRTAIEVISIKELAIVD